MKRGLSALIGRHLLLECIRFQVPTVWAAECLYGDELVSLHLEARPEARLRFPRAPVLLAVSTLPYIGHETDLHLRVTSNAFGRFIHSISPLQIVRTAGYRLQRDSVLAHC